MVVVNPRKRKKLFICRLASIATVSLLIEKP